MSPCDATSPVLRLSRQTHYHCTSRGFPHTSLHTLNLLHARSANETLRQPTFYMYQMAVESCACLPLLFKRALTFVQVYTTKARLCVGMQPGALDPIFRWDSSAKRWILLLGCFPLARIRPVISAVPLLFRVFQTYISSTMTSNRYY